VPHELDVTLQMQVTKLEAIAQVQTQILTVINQDKPKALSLAKYMRGLARQTIDGIWLTGFSLDQKAHTVTLRGRSLSADVLPEYMKKLGKEPVFSGQLFGGLQIQAPTQSVVTNTANPSDQTGTGVVEPQFVEFELKGLEVETHALATNNGQEKVKS
jgi:MSHA biogenesis protein MshI